jgi:hypothetical protein
MIVCIYKASKKVYVNNFIVDHYFHKNLFKIIISDLLFENINDNYIFIYIFHEKSNNYQTILKIKTTNKQNQFNSWYGNSCYGKKFLRYLENLQVKMLWEQNWNILKSYVVGLQQIL